MNESAISTRVTRVYRMSPSRRAVGAASLAIGVFLLFSIWGEAMRGTRTPNVVELALPIVVSIVGGVLTVRAFRGRVRLSGNAVEIRGLTRSAVLPFDKIRGVRRRLLSGSAESHSVWSVVLESNDDRLAPLSIREVYSFDDSFYEWLSELPDLDAIDEHLARNSA